MYYLIILYIFIIIFQVIYTSYISNYQYKRQLEAEDLKNPKSIEYTKWFETHKKEVEHFLTTQLKEYSSLINDKKMSYNEWINFIKKKDVIKKFNDIFLINIFQKVPNSDEIIAIHIHNTNNDQIKYDNMPWSDALLVKTSNEIDGEEHLTKDVPNTMINMAKMNSVDYITNFNIDPITRNNVIRKVFFTKWKDNQGHEGIITLSYQTTNFSRLMTFKYFDYIHKTELCLTSILLFITSFVLFYIETFKYSEIKALFFLLISNIYLTYFINTREMITNIKNEISKYERINSSILDISFLSGVNIFVINFIFKDHKKLFVETAVIFGVSILLLLTAIYKSTNQNYIEEIIGSRVTNQLVFNMAVFFNAIIILNFLFYSFTIGRGNSSTFWKKA
jgi:hypothetical protein